MINILFSTESLGAGGAERVITNLANYFSDKYNVSILSCDNNPPAYNINDKVKVLYASANNRSNKLLNNISRLKETKKLIKQNKIDIVVAFLPNPSIRAAVLRKHSVSFKLIICERNTPEREYKNPIKRVLAKKFYPRADFFVFQTKDQGEYFSETIRKKSTVIKNALSSIFIKPLPKDIQRKKYIISVARLEPQKNYALAIKAFAKIADKIPEYKYLIYGNGSLKGELQKLILELNMENRIVLKGKTDNVRDKMLESEIFVMSSDFEGSPNALIEAMACGMACISTDCPCGGPRELIKNEQNGILVETGNMDDLASAILNLATQEETRKATAQNARQIIKEYDEQKIYNQWDNLFIKMIDSNTNRKRND